jgi:hypothetical protein
LPSNTRKFDVAIGSAIYINGKNKPKDFICSSRAFFLNISNMKFVIRGRKTNSRYLGSNPYPKNKKRRINNETAVIIEIIFSAKKPFSIVILKYSNIITDIEKTIATANVYGNIEHTTIATKKTKPLKHLLNRVSIYILFNRFFNYVIRVSTFSRTKNTF